MIRAGCNNTDGVSVPDMPSAVLPAIWYYRHCLLCDEASTIAHEIGHTLLPTIHIIVGVRPLTAAHHGVVSQRVSSPDVM